MAERPILFTGDMVRAFLNKRTKIKKMYVCKGEDPNSPNHLAERLANGLSRAVDGECWEWTRSTNGRGYGTLGYNGRVRYAHRLAYELGVGEIPNGMFVLHSCDNPSCINPEHLHVGDQSQNMYERYIRDRTPIKPVSFKGEGNAASKLREADVIKIRELLSKGERQHVIAKKFGMSQSQISDISTRKSWSHI